MARHAAEGQSVSVLLLADGETSRTGAANAEIVKRREAARRACAALGARQVEFGDFPDNRLDTVALLDVTQAIEGAVRRINPGIVYTHFAGDLNVDHAVVHRAVMTACRPQPGHTVRDIRCFEVLSSTEWSLSTPVQLFKPNLFVDITGHLDAKLAALAHYTTEMRPFPHARSLEAVAALARVRGSTVGVAAAEAFVIERQII